MDSLKNYIIESLQINEAKKQITIVKGENGKEFIGNIVGKPFEYEGRMFCVCNYEYETFNYNGEFFRMENATVVVDYSSGQIIRHSNITIKPKDVESKGIELIKPLISDVGVDKFKKELEKQKVINK